MLRESSQREGIKANLNAVTSDDIDPGVEHAQLLRLLTEATIDMRWTDLHGIREEAISVLGAQSTVDALAIASGFNGITRVADAAGIPIDDYENEVSERIRESTGINEFHYDAKMRQYDIDTTPS